MIPTARTTRFRAWRIFNRIAATSSPSSASLAMKRSEEHTSELQSHSDIVCRLLLEKKTSNAMLCSIGTYDAYWLFSQIKITRSGWTPARLRVSLQSPEVLAPSATYTIASLSDIHIV